jgi:hypothetical protein
MWLDCDCAGAVQLLPQLLCTFSAAFSKPAGLHHRCSNHFSAGVLREMRSRLIAGLKRYYHAKRLEGLLSVQVGIVDTRIARMRARYRIQAKGVARCACAAQLQR